MSRFSAIFKRIQRPEPSPTEILEKFKKTMVSPVTDSQTPEGSGLPGNILVMRISLAPTSKLLTDAVTQMVACLSPEAEISFVTQSAPAAYSVSADFKSREISSYLVIRESDKVDAAKTAERVAQTLHVYAIYSELVQPSELEELSLSWLVPGQSKDTMTMSMRSTPTHRVINRLQRQRYLDPSALRTLEATHICAKGPDDSGFSVRLTRLLQGPEELIRQELPNFLHEDLRLGSRTGMASPAQLKDRLDAHPWLLGRKQALKAMQESKSQRWSAVDLGQLLAVPCGASPERPAHAVPGAVIALDHLGVPRCCYRFRATRRRPSDTRQALQRSTRMSLREGMAQLRRKPTR